MLVLNLLYVCKAIDTFFMIWICTIGLPNFLDYFVHILSLYGPQKVTVNSFELALQGWVTLQLTRDSDNIRGFLSARSVTGFLSDVYPKAADNVGKIQIIADERVHI